MDQFEGWEKDVEKRRIALRKKAEMDRLSAEREAEKLKQQVERARDAEQVQKKKEGTSCIQVAGLHREIFRIYFFVTTQQY